MFDELSKPRCCIFGFSRYLFFFLFSKHLKRERKKKTLSFEHEACMHNVGHYYPLCCSQSSVPCVVNSVQKVMKEQFFFDLVAVV